MKKIFTFALSVIAAISLSAAQRVVWTGNEPISWNTEVYAGTQFETPSGILSDLIKGDTILVSYEDKIESPYYVVTYKAGSGWDWTDLAITVEDGVISYVVESEQIATEIAERGLIFRGQGYNITSITIAELGDDPDWKETTVWSTETPFAVSWDSSSWPGTYFDTYGNSDAHVPTLKAGNVIRAYISSAEEGAQYTVVYKDGESWEKWTNLTVSVARGVLSATIPSDEVAQLLTDRGIVISGIKYYFNRIAIYAPKGGTTGVEKLSQQTQTNCQKVLKNGQLMIIRDGVEYTLNGQIMK